VYIIIAIIIFGLLIVIHELGHFLAAKGFGVRVVEFSVGMGPRLLKKQGKETLYSLRALPIGGSCLMEGEDEDSPDPRAFTAQRRWKLVGGFAAGAEVLAAISVALTGMGGARQYFELMLHFDRFTGAATSNLDSQMPSLGGFLSTSLGPIAGAGATKLLIMLGSAGMAAAAAYLARYARHDLALTFAFSMTATLLAAYHVNTHDLALLLPALLRQAHLGFCLAMGSQPIHQRLQ
jgi:membrane-associated protease RseP (regulator of RpoE activity)